MSGESSSALMGAKRAIDGVLLLDKPVNMSSAQAIARVKRLLRCEKIGHAGTLDPDASGLLVCLLGRATRLASHAEAGTKVYSGSVQLGITTTTDDVSGDVIESRPVRAAPDEIAAAALRFTGEILQVPPQVSALKVAGERAYNIARAGLTAELKARPVTVERLVVSNIGPDTFDFVCTCSKGTYIRSLARDIGAALGCGGALKSLRREASRPFTVEQARGLDGGLEAGILPWFELFPSIRTVELPFADGERVWNGDLGALRRIPPPPNGELRAVYRVRGEAPSGLLEWTPEGWRIVVNVTAPGKAGDI